MRYCRTAFRDSSSLLQIFLRSTGKDFRAVHERKAEPSTQQYPTKQPDFIAATGNNINNQEGPQEQRRETEKFYRGVRPRRVGRGSCRSLAMTTRRTQRCLQHLCHPPERAPAAVALLPPCHRHDTGRRLLVAGGDSIQAVDGESTV